MPGLPSMRAVARSRSWRTRPSRCRSGPGSGPPSLPASKLAPNEVQVWRAPGNVTIERRPPQVAAIALPQMAQPTAAGTAGAGLSFRRLRRCNVRCGACRMSRSFRCRCRTSSRLAPARAHARSCRAKEEGRIPRAPDQRRPPSQGRRRRRPEARARVHRAEAGAAMMPKPVEAAPGDEDRARAARTGCRPCRSWSSQEAPGADEREESGRITCRRRSGDPRVLRRRRAN